MKKINLFTSLLCLLTVFLFSFEIQANAKTYFQRANVLNGVFDPKLNMKAAQMTGLLDMKWTQGNVNSAGAGYIKLKIDWLPVECRFKRCNQTQQVYIELPVIEAKVDLSAIWRIKGYLYSKDKNTGAVFAQTIIVTNYFQAFYKNRSEIEYTIRKKAAFSTVYEDYTSKFKLDEIVTYDGGRWLRQLGKFN